MADTHDILTTEDGDIQFKDGDLVWGDGTYQHQRELLSAMKGSHKHAPSRGVGLVNYINDESPEGMVKMIRSEFQADAMKVNNIEFEESKLRTDAKY
jgi:hypothetical protein